MELIERIDKKELSELLSKSWMTHDGMWFCNCFFELGSAYLPMMVSVLAQSRIPVPYVSVIGPVTYGVHTKIILGCPVYL